MIRSSRSFAAALVALSLILAAACTSPAATFDAQFIDMMVPHHQGAIEMAKIAQARASRPELRALAATIITDQQREIDQMRAWRKAWTGSDATPPMERMPMVPGMTMGHGGGTMNMAQDVERLRTAGEPFDRVFIDMMREHHESAIDAARQAETRATRSEIKDLARKVIADQQREIAQMTEWRRAWYGAP